MRVLLLLQSLMMNEAGATLVSLPDRSQGRKTLGVCIPRTRAQSSPKTSVCLQRQCNAGLKEMSKAVHSRLPLAQPGAWCRLSLFVAPSPGLLLHALTSFHNNCSSVFNRAGVGQFQRSARPENCRGSLQRAGPTVFLPPRPLPSIKVKLISVDPSAQPIRKKCTGWVGKRADRYI